MKKNESINKSLWELAYDGRIAFAKVILLIVIPLLLLSILIDKKKESNNWCIDKSLYNHSIELEISNEKPNKFKKYEDYYALYFSNDRVLYSCDWKSSKNEKKTFYKMDSSIIKYKLTKKKNDNVFYVEDGSLAQKSFFFLKWTNNNY